MSAFDQLGPSGGELKLLTYLSVRENAFDLFGFLTAAERDLFLRLIEISGVGPKLALSILSGMEPMAFRRAVLTGDAKALSRIPGVGKKTADRLLMELSGAFQGKGELAAMGVPPDIGEGATDAQTEAVLALVSLGFRHPDAAQAVRVAAAKLGEETTSEVLVKEALRAL
jgi:Holliday junction DNA helicase RuvA